jgi:hypothetical protein
VDENGGDTVSFTVQYVTKFVPSAFTEMTKSLSLNVTESYLLDKENGTGFTVTGTSSGDWQVTRVTSGSVDKYNGAAFTPSGQDEDGKDIYTMNVTGQEPIKLVLESSAPASTATSALPKGTTITLIAVIDDCSPTYWYYYCESDTTTDISLSSFKQMNTTTESNESYTFEKASGGAVKSDSRSRVRENLIFIVNFENVENADAQNLSGNLQLKHTYGSETDRKELMDYVQAIPQEVEGTVGTTNEETGDADGTVGTTNEETDGEDSADSNIQYTYKRHYPAVSNTYNVTNSTTGLNELTLSLESGAAIRNIGTTTISYSVVEDVASASVNTRYNEREFSLKVTLMKDGTPVTFPEGTQFFYNGTQIRATDDQTGVILPIKSALTGSFQIKTTLKGWESVGQNGIESSILSVAEGGGNSSENSGEIGNAEGGGNGAAEGSTSGYRLVAELYSSNAAGYYNSIDTKRNKDLALTLPTTEDSVRYNLSATINDGDDTTANRLLSAGSTLDVLVRASVSGGDSNETVKVQLYEFTGTDDFSYRKVANASQVFASMPSDIAASPIGSEWKPTVVANPTTGTYRLEFTYGDKTDYLDFIVQ